MALMVTYKMQQIAFFGALLLLSSVGSANGQSACSAGSTFLATAEQQQTWPVANPGLVAPMYVNFSFPTITYPLQGDFTGSAIAVSMSEGYTGGFSFMPNSTSSSSTASTSTEENYVLYSIEIRKAGVEPAGLSQVMNHALEAVLLHQQVGGGYWASVVVPFTVSSSSAYDSLLPFFTGASMPTASGTLFPVVLSSAQPVDVNAFFDNATFQNFWGSIPTNCPGYSANARIFMRNSALNIGLDTYNSIMTTLNNAPGVQPTHAETVTYTTNSCSSSGLCTSAVALDISDLLSSEMVTQSQATEELRERKALMDQAYTNLINVNNTNATMVTTLGATNNTNGTNATAELDTAIAAEQDLKTSQSELQGIQASVQVLDAWVNQLNSYVFDSPMPAPSGDMIKAIVNASGSTSSASTASTTVAPGLLAMVTEQHSTDCSALRQSPVDINSALVVDPSMISRELLEPLRFMPEELIASPKPRRVSEGRLRISATRFQQFGSLILSGLPHPISYIELVLPGEHSLDGYASAVEVQLVHVSPDGGHATAVALMLVSSERMENKWIAGLLQKPTQLRGTPEDRGEPLAELHPFLSAGIDHRYFRYDGTLTAPPCTPTKWMLLQEPSYISAKQVASLQQLVGGSGTSLLSTKRLRFRPTLVAFGTTRLVSQVTATGLDQKYSAKRKNLLTKRRIAV